MSLETKDQIVSFETAKLAKQMNFNWDCNNLYNLNGKLEDIQYYDEEPNNFKEVHITSLELDNKDFYTAPTQCSLQKWLGKHHGIFVFVNLDTIVQGIFRYKIDSFEQVLLEDFVNHYSTYEEALEKGLQEGLKFIK